MDNKRKNDLMHLVRHIVQTACFVLAPGLFISIFSAIGNIVKALATASFTWNSTGSSVMLLLIVLPVTALMGRFFCSYMCAFGTMQEFLWLAADRLHLHDRLTGSGNNRWESRLMYVKYGILGIIAVLWIIGSDIVKSTDLWSVFGMYTSLSGWKTLAPLISLSGLMLVAVMLLSVFVERGFCRYLCPLGAVFSAISGARLVRVKKNSSGCSECGLCSRTCMMGVDMSGRSEIRSGECINCFRCVGCCPSGALSDNSKKALAAGLAATMLTAAGCSAANAVSAREHEDDTGDPQTETELSVGEDTDDSGSDTMSDVMNGTYADGVYTGTGQGFRGEITVQVTVSGGEITDIELVSSPDDQQFFDRAWSDIVYSVTESQSTDVDAVSGATFSSNGIIEAVKDALGEEYENPNSSMEGGHGGHDQQHDF